MKWYGEIGFNEYVETARGVWDPTVVKKNFFGDDIMPSWREQQGEKINPDLQVTNKLSIVADPYLQNNFHKIAYVTYKGSKWTVSSVTCEWPRLTLSLGSLYLEEEDDEE